jgi:hypothetical protein
MTKENKNIIDISLDDILLEQVTEVAMPTAAALEAFYQAYATAAGPRVGTRAGAAIFNRLADRTFGPGVDTRELHDMIHNTLPRVDLPARSALRAGEAFTKAVAGGAGQIAQQGIQGGAGKALAGKVASGVGKAFTYKGAAAGLGGLGTGLAVAGGVAGAALAGRAAWNIWHSKMKPQTDALGGVLDELQARTTKLQSKAFTSAMAGFNQRFVTAMKGAAFRDSDRVILGQAMALIDFYNNLAQGMFRVQKMQAARDISGTGGKVGVSGDSIKVVEKPKLQEDYSLQELFGFGKKKAEAQYQSDDTPADDTTTDDQKTDSKKDTGKNWESKVNSVFTTLRGQALSGAPSKFTGAIKNMWATIGFKPQKTKLPPEFNEQAIDSLVAGLINTILAPGQGGAQGALKLSEMATGIDEVLNKTLMEMSARYDLAVLTEDLQAFMMRTPELSALGQASAEAAKPPPPAEVKELQQTVPQISVNVNANANASAKSDSTAVAGAGAKAEEPAKAAEAPKAPEAAPAPAAGAPAAPDAPAAPTGAAAAAPGGTPGAEPAAAPKSEKKAPPPEAVAKAPPSPPDIKLKGKPALMGTYAFGKSLKQIQQARERNPKLKIGGPEHRAMWEKELQRIFKTKTLAEAVKILRQMMLLEAKPVKMGFGSSNSGGDIYTGPGGAVMRGGQAGFSGDKVLDKAFLDKLWAASFGYWDKNRNRTADDLMQFARDNYSSKGEIVGAGVGTPGAADTIGLQARPEASTASDYTSDPVEAEKQKQAKIAALKAKAIDPATKARLDALSPEQKARFDAQRQAKAAWDALPPEEKANANSVQAQRATRNIIPKKADTSSPGFTASGQRLPMGFTGNEFKNVGQYGQSPLVAESVITKDGSLTLTKYGITLTREQQSQAASLGLLQKFVKLTNSERLLSERISKLMNAKKVIKEGVRVADINDKLDILKSYYRQVQIALNENVSRIEMLTIPVGIKFYA